MNLLLDIRPPKIDVAKRGDAKTIGGKIFARSGFKFNLFNYTGLRKAPQH